MHGALMFPNWQPAPEPEVWECYGVPFRSVADINGDMLFVLGIGSIVYAPAANPLDFVPIPGAAIKMLVIGYSADYAEGTVSLAAMTLASNLIPTSGTMLFCPSPLLVLATFRLSWFTLTYRQVSRRLCLPLNYALAQPFNQCQQSLNHWHRASRPHSLARCWTFMSMGRSNYLQCTQLASN